MSDAAAPLSPVAPLKEVRGPSAFGGGARRFFNLLWLIATTDFKLSYFGTVFGYLWTLMRPLMLFAVLYVVFTQIFRIGSQVPHYPTLLLFSIILFTFFQEATTRAVESVVAQEGLVRKMQFPRLVIPLSIVLTAFFNLCLNLIVVFVFVFITGVEPRVTWLYLPLVLLMLAAFTAAVSMMLSAFYVRFRDTTQIWAVLVTVLFYGTPILYPAEVLEGELRLALILNPLAPLFEQARIWIIDPTAPSVTEAAGSTLGVVAPMVAFTAIVAIGLWVFSREAPRVAEEL